MRPRRWTESLRLAGEQLFEIGTVEDRGDGPAVVFDDLSLRG